MPQLMPTACAYPGCPETTRDRFCEGHRDEGREYDKNRPSAAKRGYGRRWRRLRKMVLRRQPICQCELKQCDHDPGECGEPSTEVDHLVPKSQGGTDHMGNLAGKCKTCHSRKTALEEGGFGKPLNTTNVTVVCGPPASGKSTYVKEHAKWGDLIVDLDSIWQALSGRDMYDKPDALKPFVFEARDAIMARLRQKSDVRKAWIIKGAPEASEREQLARRYDANVVLFKVSASECMRRIQNDERRSDRAEAWGPIVKRWWDRYLPWSGDEVMKR